MTAGLQKSSYQPDSTCHNLFSTTYPFFIKKGHKGIQLLQPGTIIKNIHLSYISLPVHVNVHLSLNWGFEQQENKQIQTCMCLTKVISADMEAAAPLNLMLVM